VKKAPLVCCLLATALLTGCGINLPHISGSKPVSVNSLTGSPGTNGPVLVVKVDDTPPAHPQVGLENADLVYIEQVEGGLTRLAAIFSQYPQSIPTSIGPIRSARISDIDLMAQFGKVGFAFSGAQRKMLPVIAAANLFDLGAEHNPPTIYSRDQSRSEPTNMFLDPSALLKKSISDEGKAIATAHSIGFQFGNLDSSLQWRTTNHVETVTTASLKWPSSSYQLTWSSTQKRWLIGYEHQPDLSANGVQLSADTFIIQSVSITDSIYHDKVGGITPFSNTVGNGSGYILRDGYAIPATWSRPDSTSGTAWRLLDGSPVLMKPGHIWIALTDTAPIFSGSAANGAKR
jgi:hypothetical protein